MSVSKQTRRRLRWKAAEILGRQANKPVPTKPYRPSNGHAGLRFESHQCEDCIKEDNCEHMLMAMMCDVGDKRYPPWVSDLNGDNPRCTDRMLERAKALTPKERKPKWLFDRDVAAIELHTKMKERRVWAGAEGNARFLVLTIWRYMGRADSEPLGGTGAFDHGASDDVENTVKLSLDLLEKAPLSFLLFALSELWDETQVYNGVRRLQRLVKRGEWP